MASVRCIDDASGITLSNNGRLLRNLIHGADTVMSHILHFYHLAAVDFVSASMLGSPWAPDWGATSNSRTISVLTVNNLNSNTILYSYVEALNIRRKAHSMSAIFSGRHPIQNAIVPGGVSTIFTASDVSDFKGYISTIRNFINQKYIPDVLFVATASSVPVQDWSIYWRAAAGPQKLLSYGEYPFFNEPFKSKTDLLIARGTAEITTLFSLTLSGIRERVKYSYYADATDNLHPSAGVTTPMVDYVSRTGTGYDGQYSWLKAPRYTHDNVNYNAHEVGPLARMIVTYLSACQGGIYGGKNTVSDRDGTVTQGLSGVITTLSADYTAVELIDKVLLKVGTLIPHRAPITVGDLYSPLGRHAARALECKFVADAIGGQINNASSWLDLLTLNNATDSTNPIATGSGYTYVTIPYQPDISYMGTGLAEAPRGALGHWITIKDKKIERYQCVVPSTWNASPKGADNTDRGPAEYAMASIGAAAAAQGLSGTDLSTAVNDAVLNAARVLHAYDFCIACAVHIVKPDGKEIAKFKMDTDGTVTKLPVDSE